MTVNNHGCSTSFKDYLHTTFVFHSVLLVWLNNDFEHQDIVLFKEKHSTWGLTTCAEILSRHQFSTVDTRLSKIATFFTGYPVE